MDMNNFKKIKRALISVSNKDGIVDFAKTIQGFGAEIISTGGTAKALQDAGIEVHKIADITGFPEMMDGRVKTLHPKIHGAFLALRDNEKHVKEMSDHDIEPIDLVVVNLYPFEETVDAPDVKLADAVEQIDIGGPAMIRSASKNWRDVAVVTDPKLYESISSELNENDGAISLETRQRLAALAFTRTSYYDLAISSYLAEQLSEDAIDFLEPFNPYGSLAFIELNEDDAIEDGEMRESESKDDKEESIPGSISITLGKVDDLRYGENPHQQAAIFDSGEERGIANAEKLHGKEMSFNNFIDAEAAWRLVGDFDERAVAIIKHTNPSGVGLGDTNYEAYRRALATDPVSAFGGIVALNRKVDSEVAHVINEIFTEVVIAPDFDDDALKTLKKKKNLRILKIAKDRPKEDLEFKQISGGFLIQNQDLLNVKESDLECVTKRKPTPVEVEAMMLAWKVCKHVKSNAIVLANNVQTVGVGSGQMNRVDSVRIAAMRAERTDLIVKGAALASDAFFPFRDNIDEAAKIGIKAIIQPGGSKRDKESIAAADEHNITMTFTGHRHFKH